MVGIGVDNQQQQQQQHDVSDKHIQLWPHQGSLPSLPPTGSNPLLQLEYADTNVKFGENQ